MKQSLNNQTFFDALYNEAVKFIPTAKDIDELQDETRSEIYEDDFDQRKFMIVEQNVEYGAIKAKHPGCKFIPVDFENPQIGHDFEGEHVEDEETDVNRQIQFIEDWIFNHDESNPKQESLEEVIAFDPYRLKIEDPKVPFTPALWIEEWNGIIYCRNHDGTSGGVSWGYLIVKDEKLVWDGKVPFEDVTYEDSFDVELEESSESCSNGEIIDEEMKSALDSGRVRLTYKGYIYSYETTGKFNIVWNGKLHELDSEDEVKKFIDSKLGG